MDFLGISCASNLLVNNVLPVFVPKDSLRRILASAGVEIPDKEAYWLGLHMERCVKYAWEHGELLDLALLR